MQNFWEKKDWEKSDRHLVKMKEMPFQRAVPFIPKKKGFYLVRGPRQIGKSSWLKQVLSTYTSQGVSSFYQSCETLTDFRELAELLASLRDRKLILLDEVNFVKDWDRAVKHAIDSGHTQILMVTGSHAYDLRKGADQMPGRFDAGGEFHLLPMGFDEFVQMRRLAGWTKGDRLEELRTYFRVGGFPIAVAEGGPKGKLPIKSMDLLWRWLAGDVVKLGRQEALLKELVIQLGVCLQTPLSFQTLAKKTQLGSHNTAQEYVAILESCFALRTLHASDLDTGGFRFKKDRKFYFTDPLLYGLAMRLAGQRVKEGDSSEIEAKTAEMVANEELARRYSRFGYFSNAKGEIDFVCPRQWALEVKWSPVAKNLSQTYLNFTAPEKIVWTHNNFLRDFPSAK